MISPSDNPALDDRDEFDALISSAMVDVPGAEGLEARILERLSQIPVEEDSETEEPDSKPTIAIDDPQSKRLQRRWVLSVACSAAVVLVLAAAIVPMLKFTTPPQVRLVDVEFWANAVDEKVLLSMEPYDGENPVVWPTGRWRKDLAKSNPLGLHIRTDDEKSVLAAFTETTIDVKGTPVYCRVIAIPARNIASVPSATNVASGSNKYHKYYVTTTWTENDHVYVVACTNVADLELLQDYAFGGAV